MQPPLDKLERLLSAGIQLVPEASSEAHFVFERNGFASLVERTPDGFGSIGSPGLITENGFAALVWRGANAFFVRHGFEVAASPEQVSELRAFAADLQKALG